MLYGVGRGKDEISKYVRKLQKTVTKLFDKKFSIDVSDGGRIKKHSKSDFVFESEFAKFKTLSFYDQHAITHTCGTAVVDMITAFASNNSKGRVNREYTGRLLDVVNIGYNFCDSSRDRVQTTILHIFFRYIMYCTNIL